MDRQKCLIFSLSKEKRSYHLSPSLKGNRSRLVRTKSRGANVYPLSHEPVPQNPCEINTLISHANGTHRSFAHDLWISLLISQRNTFRNRWDAYLTYSVWIAHLHAAIMDCAQPEVESSSDPRKQLAVHYARNGVLYYNFFLTSTALLK